MRSSSAASDLPCSSSSRTNTRVNRKNPELFACSRAGVSSLPDLPSSRTCKSFPIPPSATLASSSSGRIPAAIPSLCASSAAAAGAVAGCVSHRNSSARPLVRAADTGNLKQAKGARHSDIGGGADGSSPGCTYATRWSFSSAVRWEGQVREDIAFCRSEWRPSFSEMAPRCGWLRAVDGVLLQGQQLLQRRRGFPPAGLVLLLSVLLLLLRQEGAAGFQAMIELPGGGRQCIGEQLSKHVLVVGEVHLLHPVPPATASGRKAVTPLLVTALDSSTQTPIFKQQGKEHVRTAFTTTKAGTHSFCLQNTGAERMVVDIQLLWGPEARDYGQIAKAEHLDEVMVQLMRLQDRLKLYQANVLYMRQNEQKMREDSDATASWLMTFCIVNVLLLILTALASAYYFKRFFRSKKII